MLKNTDLIINNFKKNIINYMIMIIIALVFIYPIIWVFSLSVKPNIEIYRSPLRLIPSSFDISSYIDIFSRTPFITYLVNSFIYSISGMVLTLTLAVLAAYGLSRHFFKGKTVLMFLILIVQMIPGLINVIPIFLLMKNIGLYNSRIGMILLYTGMQLPFSIWVLKGFLDGIPIALDEAAYIDGASKLQTLRKVILPIIKPGLGSTAILIFINCWNEFALGSVILRETAKLPLTVGTYVLLGPDELQWRLIASAALLNIIPILIAFLYFQKYLVAGLSKGALKG